MGQPGYLFAQERMAGIVQPGNIMQGMDTVRFGDAGTEHIMVCPLSNQEAATLSMLSPMTKMSQEDGMTLMTRADTFIASCVVQER